MRKSGFTIVESLVGLALSFFIVCSSLVFFGFAQKHFFALKEKEETGQAFLAALDKIKVDLFHAGQGLVLPLACGAVEAVRPVEGGLVLVSAEKFFGLADSIGAGDVRIPLKSVADMRQGREVCIWDEKKGEVREVAEVETGSPTILITSPLDAGYIKEGTYVALLKTTHLFLDTATGVLRRQVNFSSAQPLLENVGSANFGYERGANLVAVRLEAQSQGDRAYAITIFPKNSGAAAAR